MIFVFHRFGAGGICGVVRSRQTFIGVIGGVNIGRRVTRAGAVNKGVIGRLIMSRRLSVSWRMGIVGRVSMCGFVNGDVSINPRVVRAGAVNEGVIGHVIMSGILGIVGCVNMSGFTNGDVSMGRRVNKSCRSTKKSVAVVSVGRSVVW